MACFLDRPLYFLVRGDFFAKPFFAMLLRSLHMLPVFRWQDGGYKKLKDNFSTFQTCYQALNDGRTIMIFAEGRTFYQKRLGTIQKGAARIAFGAIQAFPDIEDVYLVPVGVTYEEAHRLRSRVMIDCGEPISARAFFPVFKENNVEGLTALTEELERQLRPLLVHIEDAADDDVAERFLAMERSEHPLVSPPVVSDNREPLSREINLINWLNERPEPAKESLKEESKAYFRALKAAGLEDSGLAGPRRDTPFHTMLLALGLLPYLAGMILNILPLRAAKWLVDKKVQHIEFYSPVKLASGMGFYLLYFILLLGLTAVVAGWRGLLAVALVVPFLGYLALRYSDLWRDWRLSRRAARLPQEQRAELMQQRESLMNRVPH